jgi:hypothetical protein
MTSKNPIKSAKPALNPQNEKAAVARSQAAYEANVTLLLARALVAARDEAHARGMKLLEGDAANHGRILPNRRGLVKGKLFGSA